MAVYVDRVELGFGRMVMCHMIADTPDELHAMATRIGLQRRWFQAPPKASFWHYDIAKGKRELAIAAGALDCDRSTFVAHLRRIRESKVYLKALNKPARCPRQVFVDDGFPAGQCQRRAGHDGLCDIYDGRDEDERKAKPWTPVDGVIDFNGNRVPEGELG